MDRKWQIGISLGTMVSIAIAVAVAMYVAQNKDTEINSFQACVDAGYPVAESFPEQCSVDGKTFENPEQRKQIDEGMGGVWPGEPTEVDGESIQLVAVEGYSGRAIATRLFADGTFTHTVEASVADPAEGKFYEGWLVKDASAGEFFSTGKMEKKDDKWVLHYTSNSDQSDYSTVVITEETSADGLDGKPEAHVFEGKF